MKEAINNLIELRQYIGDRLAYYKCSSSDLERYDRSMENLIKRSHDPNLYLGIVGEFSTGKSSFINALLGMEVLKEDILPGTTCAPTFLCYGEKFDIEIFTDNGEVLFKYSSCVENVQNVQFEKVAVQDSRNELINEINNAREFIYKYTADEDNARDISRVMIYMPCDNQLFRAGIVIVDTPGINADIERHQEVTSYTVKQVCDLAIVLTPASSPCSKTLLDFVADSLDQSQEYCIGLITQIDKIRKNERKKHISYVRERFASEGIKFQDIFAVSSYSILHADEYHQQDEVAEFQKDFFQIIERICEKIKEQKGCIISQKLNNILQLIINEQISPFVIKTQKELQERYNDLQNNKLQNFDEFLSSHKLIANTTLEKTKVSQEEISQLANKARMTIESRIKQRINSSTSKSELNNVISLRNIRYNIRVVQSEIINIEIDVRKNKISDEAGNIYLNFVNEFNTEFRNLGKYTNWSNSSVSLQNDNCKFDRNITRLESLEYELKEQKKKMINGAVIGGIIGTLLGGPLGAVVGGGIGSYIASKFGKSLPELKEEAIQQITNSLKSWEEGLIVQLSQDVLEKYYDEVKNQLLDSLNQYNIYQPRIEEIIKTERYQQAALKRLITQIDKDKELLNNIASMPSQLFTES